MAWKASIRDHAAQAERTRAWAAEAEADDAMGRVADACGRAVDAQGRLDTESLGRVVATMREASEVRDRASQALARSSSLHKKTGAGLKRASMAYKRAADPKYAAEVRDRAARAYEHARTLADLAANVRREARNLVRNADMLEAGAAKWSSAGGGALAGGGGALPSIVADMREHAGQARAGSNEIGEKLERAERAAAKVRKMSAEMAMRSAAGAAKAVPECGDGGPDVQRAAAAWRKATAAASRADAGKG